MLADLSIHGSAAWDRDALVLAILFHDAIYDGRRVDNETASAALARNHLRDLGVSSARIDRVEHLILATRHRAEDIADADADTALLLDLDLAILAASSDRFQVFVTGVRQEYAHVPDDTWQTGRARVLKSFIARRQIYTTPALAAFWEAAARANVTRELECLVSA